MFANDPPDQPTTVFVMMNRTTPNLLRHWIVVLSDSKDVRLPVVLSARERIRRGTYAHKALIDPTVERLVHALT